MRANNTSDASPAVTTLTWPQRGAVAVERDIAFLGRDGRSS